MLRICLALLISISFIPQIDAEGPRSVYGPSAPGDSAFVRVINLLPDPVRVSLGATRIGPVPNATVSAYQPVIPDIYVVRAGGQESEVVPKKGAYITLACNSTGIIVFDDPAHTNPARAQLFLYNLTTIPVIALKSADGKTPVIPDVGSGHSASITVNAVSVALGVFDGTSLLKPLDPVALTRGSSFSVFALGDKGAVTLLVVKAQVKVK